MSGFVDSLGDAAEGLVDKGRKALGGAADAMAHVVGDGLDAVGLHSAARSVDRAGDSVADAMGAEVGEMDLDQADRPSDVIHGDPKAIRESAARLGAFFGAFEEVGSGLGRLDTDHWKGESADAFRERFAPHPQHWLTAADACEQAGKALERYAQTVEWAQEQARSALETYKAAKRASENARSAYNDKVAAYNLSLQLPAEAGSGPAPAKPGPFHDPGEAGMAQAREIVARARQQRDREAEATAAAVSAATSRAPATPAFTERMTLDGADLFHGQQLAAEHFDIGVLGAAADAVKFARGLNPEDVYNITHPALYLDHLNLVGASMLHAHSHPVDLVKGLVGSGWGSDPADSTGRMTLNALLGIGTDGASTAETAGMDAAEKMAQGSADSSAVELSGHSMSNSVADSALGSGEESAVGKQIEQIRNEPRDFARENDTRTETGDPIDVATGRMTMAQADVVLPGSLPLAFTRSFDSGYRMGRWMGPSWSCTADQRLEIDEAGIVLIRQDGVVLVYPHPEPGRPTMPVEGPRWPLHRDGVRYLVEDPKAGLTRTFTVHDDRCALLTELTDRTGHRIAFEYDSAGVPVAVRHAAGYHLRIDTDAGRITALALAGAAADGSDLVVTRYGYTDGHLTEVFDSYGRALRFGYDGAGRIVDWTDRNGSHYAYTYDDLGRCVHQGGDDGVLRYTFDYDGTDPQTGLDTTTVTNSLGHKTRYLINAARQVVAEIDPLGAVTRSEWDRYDRLLSRTDPLGHTVRFRYDDSGNRVAVTRPDGREARTDYDEQGRPVRVTAPDGATWRREYDDVGNPLTITDPSGAVTRYTYDATGHPSSVTDALGSTRLIRCDAAGRVTQTTDPLGAVTRYTHDAFGRVASATDPAGRTTRMEWTIEGRPARKTHPDGTTETWRYDGEGNLIERTTPTGETTRYEYTHFNLLTARTDPDGTRHEFDYDTELRLTRVTNPQGLTWTYRYDAAGRRTAETDFNGRTITYTHDAAGRLTARRNTLGQVVTYRYNALGRVIAKDADGAVTTFEHDQAGRVTKAHSPDAELVCERDALGRITAETCNGRTMTHQFDALGRRTRRRTPAGAETAWHFDAAGRCTTLETAGRQVALEYDTLGRETTRRFDDTLTLTQAWDVNDRLVEQTLAGPARTLHQRSYTYRPDGHLTGIDDHLYGRRTFDLDPAGRVTAVQAPQWTERYVYDELGNITEADWPTTHASPEAVGTRSYTGTLINRAGQVRYEHDAQGRIVLRQKARLSRKPDTWRYTWDAEDRLTGVVTPDGQAWRYLYDPLGRRIAKARLADDGTVLERTDFAWDGPTLAEQTTDAPQFPGPVTLTWDHKGLQPVAQTERIASRQTQQEIDQRFFSIVTDLIGTPSELVDENGSIAWRSRSTLWGNTTWAADSTTYTPLRFPGQYFDPETRLHYNVHRYYDPETARYASPDPLGLAPAPNPHAYVHNPTTWTDLLGLSPTEAKPTGTAPAFVVDSNGMVQDVRGMGRPDNELVFSGHGGTFLGDGSAVTVPDNTYVVMYSEHGDGISNKIGWEIETGDPAAIPKEIYGPGEKLPNYTLGWGDDIFPQGAPRTVTVTGPTRLSELLRPNMGRVHWAACRKVLIEP